MSNLPKEWRFLKAAWIYSLAVTGSASAATESLSAALDATVARHDVFDSRRRRRFLLAHLRRICEKSTTPQEIAANPPLGHFKQLAEPGRSALLMFYLRLLPMDEIADVVGCEEKKLPEILEGARVDLGAAMGGVS